jgi:hypothetical protein
MNKNLDDLLARLIDYAPIDAFKFDRDDAEAMIDSLGESGALHDALRDAFRDNIPDFRY